MCLGALIHAGVPLEYLTEQLAKLGIKDEFCLRIETVCRNQQAATKVHVDLLSNLSPNSSPVPSSESLPHHTHHHAHLHDHEHPCPRRKLPEIEKMIQHARLPEQVTTWSLAIFRQLATAEANVHGITPEQVHFHEVGATDAIVDIVGTCLGLDWLEIDQIICSPLPTGGGTVRCEHGLLPVPVPAVLAMMATASVPVYSNQIEKELVTPTGCAIAITLSKYFGPPPRFTLNKIGLGAGGRDLPIPNILRLWIGTVPDVSTHPSHTHQNHTHQDHTHQNPIQSGEVQKELTETIVELKTQIDDCSPQAIGFVFEQLFGVGAVDVFTQGVAMKKNRLGTLLTVICPVDKVAACEAVLFAETTTLGIRQTNQKRTALEREIVSVSTAYGEMAVKLGLLEGKVVNVQPEYEDVAKGARSHNLPWKAVHQAAMRAATDQLRLAPTCSD